MIYLPGTGILAAYTDKATGELNAEFPQALAIYIWAWFTLAMIFTIGAVRSSWVLMADLLAVDLYLALAACGYMTGNESLIKGSSGMGFVVAFLSCESLSPSSMLVYGEVEDANGFWNRKIGRALQGCMLVVLRRGLFLHFRCTMRSESCSMKLVQPLPVKLISEMESLYETGIFYNKFVSQIV
jgi:hypothetical protein